MSPRGDGRTARPKGSAVTSDGRYALITGGRGIIPERGQLYEISTLWIRDGNDWLLLKAEWTPAAFENVL